MKIETKFNKSDKVYFIQSTLEALPYINRGCVISVNVIKDFVAYDIIDYCLHPITYERVREDVVFHTASEAIQYIAKEMEHRIKE